MGRKSTVFQYPSPTLFHRTVYDSHRMKDLRPQFRSSSTSSTGSIFRLPIPFSVPRRYGGGYSLHHFVDEVHNNQPHLPGNSNHPPRTLHYTAYNLLLLLPDLDDPHSLVFSPTFPSSIFYRYRSFLKHTHTQTQFLYYSINQNVRRT